jgi:hypothetical protein
MWAKQTQDEVTNPSARIRQEKPPRRPAVLWPNEPEKPPTSDWAEMADWAERTQRQAAARTKPVPSPSRLNPPTRLSVEKSPVFFLLFTGKAIFYARCGCARSQPSKGPIRRKSRRSERTRGAKLTRQPGYFGRTNPRRQPGQHLPNDPKGQPGHACGQTNQGTESRFRPNEPKVRASPASSPNEPDEQPSRSCFRQMNPRCSPVPV